MLKYLHIENIAVIEQTNIDFEHGFNVLTGETGAGKSIIIDAINAVLGERTSKDLIRNGANEAVVSAVFADLCENVKSLLAEKGFFADEDGNFVIQRVLTPSSSSIRINGQAVPAATLRSIAPMLLNIHGQHDNQALLNPDNHYIYLDMIAENSVEKNAYIDEFKNFNSIRSRLKEIDFNEDEKLRKIDLLKYQIAEIECAGIRVGEYALLKQKSEACRNLEKKLSLIDRMLMLFSGDDEHGGILSDLAEAATVLCANDWQSLSKQAETVTESLAALSSVKEALEDEKYKLCSDEYNPDAIEARLEMLGDLMRKYGNSEEKMIEFLENATQSLKAIEFNDEELERLSTELEASKERLVQKGEKLSQTRKKAAAIFENEVIEVLKLLNMPNVLLKVEHNIGRYSKNGCDEIQFLISANAGENLKPLTKIASGGELSRVMLAIKSVLAEKDDVDTLIFDEIDTGISGRAADKVGEQLKKVSKARQVICVTHLAQIAARADNHLLIEKSVRNDRTYTEITSLKGESRVEEIARIMGGTKITDQILASAKELLTKN